MPRCHKIRPQFHRLLQKHLKLDFTIAHHIRVRRAVILVFSQKILYNLFPIFFLKIPHIKWNPQDLRYLARILGILNPGTAIVAEIFRPIFHEYTHNIIALLFEQGGGN